MPVQLYTISHFDYIGDCSYRHNELLLKNLLFRCRCVSFDKLLEFWFFILLNFYDKFPRANRDTIIRFKCNCFRRTRRQDIRNGDPLTHCSDLQHHGKLQHFSSFNVLTHLSQNTYRNVNKEKENLGERKF